MANSNTQEKIKSKEYGKLVDKLKNSIKSIQFHCAKTKDQDYINVFEAQSSNSN